VHARARHGPGGSREVCWKEPAAARIQCARAQRLPGERRGSMAEGRPSRASALHGDASRPVRAAGTEGATTAGIVGLETRTGMVERTRRRKDCACVTDGRARVGGRRRPTGGLRAELDDVEALERAARNRGVRTGRSRADPHAVRADWIRAHAAGRAPAVDGDRGAGSVSCPSISGVAGRSVAHPAVARPGAGRRTASAAEAEREQAHDGRAPHAGTRAIPKEAHQSVTVLRNRASWVVLRG
jgi:hypothetical protein